MVKKSPFRLVPGSGRAVGPEWIGGMLTLPAYVTDEQPPYRPECLVWMGPDGAVLGTEIGRPGEVLSKAGACLSRTIARPLWGSPHAPARVRVADGALADVLRAGHPRLEVVCAETPELEDVLRGLQYSMAEGQAEDVPYLLPSVPSEAIASFHRAATELYRLAPWKVVTNDFDAFRLDIPSLDVGGAVFSVIGQQGESRGLVLFSGMDDFERFAQAGGGVESGGRPDLPANLSINYDPRDRLRDDVRRTIDLHGGKVVIRKACPWLLPVDETIAIRSVTPQDVAVAEATVLALSAVLRESRDLVAALEGGTPWARTLSVLTHAGPRQVTLSLDAVEDLASELGPRPTNEILGKLWDLDPSQADHDATRDEKLEELTEEVLGQFEQSPEAQALYDGVACQWLVGFAESHIGATIATLQPDDLETIVFEIIPRKVSIEASEARGIVETLRAFYAFLGRAYALPQAGPCLRVLGRDAVPRLEVELSDPRNFGMAKSFAMGSGRRFGTPPPIVVGGMASSGGEAGGGGPPEAGIRGAAPPVSRARREADRAREKRAKQARKAARKARRRNR